MDRRDFYYKQRVTEGELDDAFDQAEEGLWRFAEDVGLSGIHEGLVATQHAAVQNLTIDLSSPGLAFDALGRRIFVDVDQVVDCSVDENGVSTAVGTVGQERWIAVFAAFDRNLADPRVDGNAQTVYFIRDESFAIVVRQGAAANVGLATRVALDSEMILICDVKLVHSQTQILNADISTSRRQTFQIFNSSQIPIDQDDATAEWDVVSGATVQAAFDSIDDLLHLHFNGTANRHTAADIDNDATGRTYAVGANLDAALDGVDAELVTLDGRADGHDADIATIQSSYLRQIGTGTSLNVPADSTVTLITVATKPHSFVVTEGFGSTIVQVGPFDGGSGSGQSIAWMETPDAGAHWDVKVTNRMPGLASYVAFAYHAG